jgi:hypothetical protein
VERAIAGDEHGTGTSASGDLTLRVSHSHFTAISCFDFSLRALKWNPADLHAMPMLCSRVAGKHPDEALKCLLGTSQVNPHICQIDSNIPFALCIWHGRSVACCLGTEPITTISVQALQALQRRLASRVAGTGCGSLHLGLHGCRGRLDPATCLPYPGHCRKIASYSTLSHYCTET